jgi:Asp-tRNA(Asn)/Glu-tRNA(Gln) amidotransferase A subunit family amidase
MLGVMADDDARDPLAYTLHGRAVRRGERDLAVPRPIDLASLRVAASPDLGFAPTERHIARVFAARIAAIAPLFGQVAQAHPDCTGTNQAFSVLRATSFVAAHAAKVRDRPQDVGAIVRANVAEGLGYGIEDVALAFTEQTRIYRGWQRFFADHDLLLTPAITISPRPWSEWYPAEIDGRPTESYFHWLALAYAVTLVGHPAISLPLGVDEAGMPFGLQIVGPRGGDALVIAAAAALEAALAGDATLGRPVPDLAKLKAATPISAMPGFLDGA